MNRRGTTEAALEPMYATIAREIPAEGDWTFEPKWDGVRVLAHADADRPRLITRNQKDKARQFPEVAEALRDLARELGRAVVLDGEIVAVEKGRPARFQKLQGRTHLKSDEDIRRHAEEEPTSLIVFDLLREGRESLLAEPWTERRARLERVLNGRAGDRLRVGETSRESGERLLRHARTRGWEGIIAKRTDSTYRPGKRSYDWLKLKVEFRQEFVVGGWTEPQRSRKHLGSLLVGYYDGDELVFAGGVGTGFTRESLKETHARLQPLERENPPFRDPPTPRTPAHWVEPRVVVELKFSEWTADGKLRTPVFLGVRDDKDAREVTREGASVQGGG